MSKHNGLLFVVDDDPHLSALVAELLRAEGYAVATFTEGEAALRALSEAGPAAVLLDLNMPGLSGESTLERLVALNRHLPVIILTAERDVERVVAVIRKGAYDFVPKPLDTAKLLTAVQNAVERHHLSTKVAELTRQHEVGGFPGLIGQSRVMRDLARQIERVAATDVTVHIHGESGTGKELVARAIHDFSGRKLAPFAAINCAALPESLQESELFGHEKGAFTGAVARKPGRFELVQGGTLLLDEVAELKLEAQAKLLRVLQERKVQRVGGVEEVAVDFRLLTATHRDLAAEVKAGRFREDLYYRIVVFELEVPALKERPGDVVLLARHFVARHGPRLIGATPVLDPEVELALARHAWPGNVRELENVVQRSLVSCDRVTVRLSDLPPRLAAVEPVDAPRAAEEPVVVAGHQASAVPVESSPSAMLTLEDSERRHILRALEAAQGNRTLAAQRLGIGRTTLYRKLKDYGME